MWLSAICLLFRESCCLRRNARSPPPSLDRELAETFACQLPQHGFRAWPIMANFPARLSRSEEIAPRSTTDRSSCPELVRNRMSSMMHPRPRLTPHLPLMCPIEQDHSTPVNSAGRRSSLQDDNNFQAVAWFTGRHNACPTAESCFELTHRCCP